MITACELAARFGLKRTARDWRGTCPACGYGGGALMLSADGTGRPLAWCASCQDRDAIARAIGGDILARMAPCDIERTAAERARQRDKAIALWHCSVPAIGTLADAYLIKRGLAGLAASTALRFRADTSHPHGGQYPALIALVCDVHGQPIAVHRTFLRRDGQKADVEPAKASLGPVWNGAIRLQPIEADKPMVIGEGIESAASAGHLMGFPAWAAISAGNMANGLVLPPDARSVVIAADPDEPGRKAARDAWTRWRADGRLVSIATPNGSADFNDVLRMREAEHA
jgi:phage/plasmid primase-like uncharacterized protein